MALFITLVGTVEGEKELHVGEKGSLKQHQVPFEMKVRAIQADGDELERIRSTFSGIPMPAGCRVVRWEGEMANFIAKHLY